MTDTSTGSKAKTAATIDVADPARGTTIASIPSSGPRTSSVSPTPPARAARLGRDGLRRPRPRLRQRAAGGSSSTATAMIDTISSETGKTHEDAQLELSVAAQSFAFWAKNSEDYLADERLPAPFAAVPGRQEGRRPL